MPPRALSKRLHHHQTRDLIEAAHHASTLKKPLNTFVAINPRLLNEVPACIADWTNEVLNNVRIYMKRRPVARGSKGKRKVGYYLIWTRENYEGTDREHLHFVVHCPVHEMQNFRDALRRWYPGEDKAIYVEKARIGTNRFTRRRQNFSLTYVLKQCTPQARWATGFQIMYDKGCKHTGAKVARVLGKRCGVSATLDWKAREAYRLRPREILPKAACATTVEALPAPILTPLPPAIAEAAIPHPRSVGGSAKGWRRSSSAFHLRTSTTTMRSRRISSEQRQGRVRLKAA